MNTKETQKNPSKKEEEIEEKKKPFFSFSSVKEAFLFFELIQKPKGDL